MINSDRWTGLFLLILSFYVCSESWRLGLGNYFRPGPGFFPFYSSLLLGALALTLILLTFRHSQEKAESWANSSKIVSVCLATLGFAFLLDWLGFIGTVFLFIFFLLRMVERRRWLFCAGAGILTSVACYVVFQLWLRVQLPTGIFAR